MFGWDRQQTVLVLVVLALAAASFLLRVPCLAPDAGPLALAVPGCNGDLAVMWFHRGLAEGRIPYLQPVTDPVTGLPTTVEYPVLTGLVMWLFALPGSYPVFLGLNAALMGLAAATTAVIVYRHRGSRAWLWAAAPALVCYLAYNDDALAALAATAGLALVLRADPAVASRRAYLGAAVVFGLGGAVKFFPLLFLLPEALWLAFGSLGSTQLPAAVRLRRAAAALGAGAGAFVLVNLPVALLNPRGWLLPYAYQGGRRIDATALSVWFVAATAWPQVPAMWWTGAAALVTAVSIVLVAAAGWRRGRALARYPLLGSSIAMLAAYLAFNKVFSPQYVLWLLPLLALSRIRVGAILGYQGVDLLLFACLAVVGYSQVVAAPALGAVAAAVLLGCAAGRLAWVVSFAVTAPAEPPSGGSRSRYAASE